MSKSNTASNASGCFICKSPEDDELLFGKFYSKWRIRVHYYCLLLTSNLVQNGETDEAGIFGFLQKDIRNEEARIRNQKCYVCKERYANISCCARKCFRTFHTICGIRKGCLSHFADTYQSWCDKHVELEDTTSHDASDVCGICYDVLGPYRKLESIRAPCCQNGWFHRPCVAQFAQSAGYFFKCPLCNNKEEFSRAMQLMGVYVPEKDAAWELEPNAFSEQLERPGACDAETCLCRFGRDYDTGKWDLRLCTTCGSTCRHDLCMESPSKNYVCTLCRPIVSHETLAAVLALEAEEAAKRDDCSSSSDEDSHKLNGTRYESGIHSPGSSNRSSGSSSSSMRIRAARRNRSVSTDSSGTDFSDIPISATSKRKKRCIGVSDSSADSLIVNNKKRKSCRRLSALASESSDSDVVGRRRKKSATQSRLASSSESSVSSLDRVEIQLDRLTKRIPLSGESIDKLLNARLIIMLDKLSEEQIKTLTSSESDDASSTASSAALFNFNYRMKLNKKQRRRSHADFQSVKEIIRSDTETLTDSSCIDFARTKTSARRRFSKQLKLKPLGSKSCSKKCVEPASSASDSELPTKKACLDANHPPLSKRRMSVFPPRDDENTCPNSPLKSSAETQAEQKQPPALIELKPHLSLFPPPPSVASVQQNPMGGSNNRPNTSIHQTTLNSFFKKTPPSGEFEMASSNEPNNSAISSVDGGSETNEKMKTTIKITPASARKKLVELDRGQRNLLDFFNRC